ncbi:alpha/beta hydrolase fold domain-containing protein [Paenibacillus senegalimassiliensis]|uniref:alpha/beta hydrolase fold domain-containing protein n=1 Tax=Paenibacillus senegalimassiliensis TaxID=1737426 RepID=UPI000B31D40B|nr:alpha/beta hydrolase [Paenibacillus senegalimassiliensis]
MRRWMIPVVLVVLIACWLGGRALYFNQVEHRSYRSKIFSDLIVLSGSKKTFASEELMVKSLEGRIDSKEYELPDKKYKSEVTSERLDDYAVYTFNDKQDSEQTVVIYVHGGAWVQQPLSFHWKFIDKLAQATDARVVVPIYPKAPEHTFEETYELLQKLYQSVLDSVDAPSQITLMGDSAGGNIILGFGQQLAEAGIPQPKDIVALSPTMDLSFQNPLIDDYVERDPMLAVPGALYAAKKWAGDEELTSPRISPLFGNFDKVAKVTVFVGTYEGGYPDSVLWDEKLNKQGIDHNFFVYSKMAHVFPLYPIPEAKEAFDQILSVMSKE